jgi:hypothetical protein
MSALIIGADRLGNIPDLLKERGIEIHHHWDGRKKGMRRMSVPSNVDMVIVLYDFIEHQFMENIKQQAKRKNIPCVYSRRTVSDLVNQLDRCAACKKCR